MPSTRASAGRMDDSLLAGDKSSQYLLRQLEISGAAALRGGKIDHQPAVVCKCSGASYEVAKDGISWAQRGVKRRAAAAEPASPPPAAKRQRKRQRRPGEAKGQPKSSISARPSRKRKLDGSSTTTDEEFLAETIRQVKRVKVALDTTRAAELEEMLPYLQAMKQVCRHYIVREAPPPIPQWLGDPSGDDQSAGLAPDAYLLDSRSARTVLQSTNRLECPVFLARGAPFSIFDSEIDPRRPIEQVLDWLSDPDEKAHTRDVQAQDDVLREVTVAEIRNRFINQQHKQQRYPWNFPEIPFSMPAPEMPGYLRHPSCNLLIDIVRFVQDIGNGQICPATCKYQGITADRCPTHFQTADEIIDFRDAVQQWLGTIMMAEAGAYTAEYHDTFGFGTFISCYEGEIGLAYQTTAPTPPTKGRKKTQTSKQWLYKVMGPGDASDSSHSSVRLTVDDAVVEDDPDYFCRVVRGLVMGARHYIDKAKAHNTLEKFGGTQKVKDAEKVLCMIDKKLQKLLKERR